MHMNASCVMFLNEIFFASCIRRNDDSTKPCEQCQAGLLDPTSFLFPCRFNPSFYFFHHFLLYSSLPFFLSSFLPSFFFFFFVLFFLVPFLSSCFIGTLSGLCRFHFLLKDLPLSFAIGSFFFCFRCRVGMGIGSLCGFESAVISDHCADSTR